MPAFIVLIGLVYRFVMNCLSVLKLTKCSLRFRELDDEHMFIKDIETLNHEKKIRGFFTVTVYIFAVSFLAILLSIYYIFVWSNPNIQAYCWYMKVRQM